MIILFQTLNLPLFLQKGRMGHYERFSESQGIRYSWAKTWVSTISYKLFVWTNQLFNWMARGGFPTLWTINNIQMIFKSSEIITLGNYIIKMLGTIFGKLYDFDLEQSN